MFLRRISVVSAVLMWALFTSKAWAQDAVIKPIVVNEVMTTTQIVTSNLSHRTLLSDSVIPLEISTFEMHVQLQLSNVDGQMRVVSAETLAVLPDVPVEVFDSPEFAFGGIFAFPEFEQIRIVGISARPNSEGLILLDPDSTLGIRMIADKEFPASTLLKLPQISLMGVLKLNIENTTSQTITLLSDYVTLVINGEQAYVSRSSMGVQPTIELGPRQVMDDYGLPFVLFRTTYESISESRRLNVRLVGPHVNDKYTPLDFRWEFRPSSRLTYSELLDLSEEELTAITICAAYQYAHDNRLEMLAMDSTQAYNSGVWAIANNRVCAESVATVTDGFEETSLEWNLDTWAIIGCIAGRTISNTEIEFQEAVDTCISVSDELSGLAEGMRGLKKTLEDTFLEN